MEPEARSRIVVDSEIRHGKPIIEGTRITADEIMGALVGGMTYEEIKMEYGIEKRGILAVHLDFQLPT